MNNTLATLVEKVDVLEWAEEANRKFTLLEKKYGVEVVKEYLRYINTDIDKFKKKKKYWQKLLQSTDNFTFDGTTVQIKPSDLDNLPMFCYQLLQDIRLRMTEGNQATVCSKIINWSADEENSPLPLVDEDLDPYPGKDFNYRVSQEPPNIISNKKLKSWEESERSLKRSLEI